MSGCYRCGLSEGSEHRLCETCYRLRFHSGRDVVDLPPGVEPEGLEFSPKTRTLLLSSSAMLYVSFLGFVLAFHHQTQGRTYGDSRLEYYHGAQHHSVVASHQEFGSLQATLRLRPSEEPQG
jgi:hypothetical protein